MLDLTKATDAQLLEQIDPIDFGIRMVTNPARYSNDVGASGSPAMLTGKGFYHYIGIIWDVISKIRHAPFELEPGLTVETVVRGIERTVFPQSDANEPSMEAMAASIETIRYHIGWLAPDSVEAKSLNNLIKFGLVKDPLIESISGMSLLVLGAIPFSFSKRTQNGDVVYRRITSILWEYESKKNGDAKEVVFHLRMQKAVTLLLDTIAARAKKEDLLAEEPKS
jgi:hypothetical protein